MTFPNQSQLFLAYKHYHAHLVHGLQFHPSEPRRNSLSNQRLYLVSHLQDQQDTLTHHQPSLMNRVVQNLRLNLILISLTTDSWGKPTLFFPLENCLRTAAYLTATVNAFLAEFAESLTIEVLPLKSAP
jgi:hypothetical protein